MAKANRVLIFVYGTLLNGCGNHSRYLKRPEVKFVADDTIQAKMYTAHWGFPHVHLSESLDDKVFGEVYDVPMVLVTDGLDHLEGYDPERKDNLYNRKTTITGSGREVFVYEAGSFIMRRPCAYLPGGDWRKALEEREIMPEKFPMSMHDIETK